MPESKSDNALKYAEQIAYSSKEVLRFTYDQAVKYKDSPGVYVECGVAAGAQIIAMAAGAPNKTIYAFDSFEGIPLPSNKDDQYPGIRMMSLLEQSNLPNPGEQVLKTSGATSVSEEDFLRHIYNAFPSESDLTRIIPVPGWFEETVPFSVSRWEDAEKVLGFKFGISILRLDGDLYNSTYVCLKYLYPKVIEFGRVIIDDWALSGCREAAEDYFIETYSKEYWETLLKYRMQFIEGDGYKVCHWKTFHNKR